LKFYDKTKSDRPASKDDFLRIVPWKEMDDMQMGCHPEKWLVNSRMDQSEISIDEDFVFPAEETNALTTPTQSSTSSSSSSKKARVH
jgi:hypothetical protein